MKHVITLIMATMISCQPLHNDVEKTEISFSVDNIIDFIYDKNLDSYYIEYMDYDVFDLEHMNELSNNQFNDYIVIKVDKDMFFTILEEINTKPSREVSKKYKIIEYYNRKTFEYLLKKK